MSEIAKNYVQDVEEIDTKEDSDDFGSKVHTKRQKLKLKRHRLTGPEVDVFHSAANFYCQHRTSYWSVLL